MSDNLWMLEDSERCYEDPYRLYESELDHLDHGRGPWTILECERLNGRRFIPSSTDIKGYLLEWIKEMLYLDAGDLDSFMDVEEWDDGLYEDPAIEAIAGAFQEAVAKHVTWFQTGRVISTHQMSMEGSGDPGTITTIYLDDKILMDVKE